MTKYIKQAMKFQIKGYKVIELPSQVNMMFNLTVRNI